MTQAFDYMLRRINDKESQRNWSQLPGSFEVDAVRWTFEQIKPHFTKREIRQRVSASKALTFADLREAITK